MILQQIRLKGFLGHRGQPDGNGGFDFMTVDWRAASLWLVHGRNGAGKSSLFDAISFALWKRARGKGEGGTNFDRLIHHGCNRAEIELYIEIGGQEFRITRVIDMVGRGEKKRASVSGQVFRREGQSDDWHVETGFDGKPEKWAEAALGMTWKTFSYAVLLRQGEADAFLKAEPKDRRDCLWQLLDLDHFENLGKGAEDESRAQARAAKDSTERLEAEVAVSKDEIERQNALVAQAEKAVRAAQAKHQANEQALRDARHVADWREKIEAAQIQQGDDAPLLERADEIRAQAKRERAIKEALPFFNVVWDVRQTLATETTKWQKKSDEATRLQSEIEQTKTKLQVAQSQRDDANTAWQKAQDEYDAARKDAERLQRELSTLAAIEELETRISEAQKSIEPHHALLQRAPEIERNFKRFGELQKFLPSLRAWNEAQSEVLETREALEAARIAAEKSRVALEDAQCAEEVLQAHAQQAAQVLKHHEETLREKQTELARLEDRFKVRQSIEGHEECPACGSRLDSDDARHRLLHESRTQREESARREEEILAFQKQREAYSVAKDNADKAHQAAREASQIALEESTIKASEETSAMKALSSRERAVEKANRDCGVWTKDSGQLEELETEFQNLHCAPQEKEDLQHAQIAAGKAETALKLYQENLETLPQWDETQRIRLRQDDANAQQRAGSTQIALDEAKELADTKDKIARDLEKQLGKTQSDHRTAEAQRDDLWTRREDAARRLERALTSLPQAWQGHSAREDEQALSTLRDEQMNLSDAPMLAEKLDAAQTRSARLGGEIQTLRDQIKAIPEGHRRAPDEVENELHQVGEVLEHMRDEYSVAQESLRELQNRQTEYSRLEAERDAAVTEARLSKKLAEALGKSGLQAEILGDAQRKLSHYANKTLDNLSKGRWQIALEPNENGNGLEVLARDMDHPLRPVLAFEQTSSGEQFRIAVATAIAIGQAVSGRQAMSTLIVDEGFGRLDKDNRDLMVDELRRLSLEILNGGRVIVVSHQDDVCEQFDYRLRVERDGAGVACVETTLAGN